ncbi:MAG: HD domain-containing phosphohydrolase [Acidimicrobiia bacterium]
MPRRPIGEHHARQGRRRMAMTIGYAVVGIGTIWLAASFATGLPEVGVLLPLLAVNAYLGFRSVEVNGNMSASSSGMVLLAGGVASALLGASAVFTCAILAAGSALQEADIKGRRVHEPIWNFGQLAVTGALVGAAVELGVGVLGSSPLAAIMAAGLASAVHLAVNLGQVYLIVRFVYSRSIPNLWSGMATLIPSSLLVGLVGGVLGYAYVATGGSTLLFVLMMVLFLVGHQAFVSFGTLREAHEATLAGFVKALEAKDLYTRGHAERVAHFAILIGEEMGLRGNRLESLNWAALLHDIGKLVVPKELIQKKGRLTEEEWAVMRRHDHAVGEILNEVEFLEPMVEIAEGTHHFFDGERTGQRPSRESAILAVADAFDAITTTRSYRVALSQQYAFEELRRCSGSQFMPEAVEALVRAIEARGEIYGSPDIHDEETARAIAEGRDPAEASRRVQR